MPLVTLIGEKIAKKDIEFVYLGPNNECRNCKIKTVCFNLKPGRKYKITNVRDKRHNCNVHEGTAAVVEVQELPIILAIDQNLSEGTEIDIEDKECRSPGCIHYELCNVNVQKDKKYKISKIFGVIECPIGNDLKKAELSNG
jgi:uncharacterized protein (UPF0179 family)